MFAVFGKMLMVVEGFQNDHLHLLRRMAAAVAQGNRHQNFLGHLQNVHGEDFGWASTG